MLVAYTCGGQKSKERTKTLVAQTQMGTDYFCSNIFSRFWAIFEFFCVMHSDVSPCVGTILE